MARLVTASFTLAEAEGSLLYKTALGWVTQALLMLATVLGALATVAVVGVGIFFAVLEATNLVMAVFVLAGALALMTGIFLLLSKVTGASGKSR